MTRGAPLRAEGVCGDMARDLSEQCDDGNLVNGDGCSSLCTIERCGNGVLDAGEQCDPSVPANGRAGDGNTVDGDGCNYLCQVEFCGDRSVQDGLGEECDDGNGVSGDGCSSLCKLEGEKKPESSSSSSVSSEQTLVPTPPPEAKKPGGDGAKGYWLQKQAVSSSAESTVVQQAISATQFLALPAAEDYKQYFSREENLMLEGIMVKLRSGRRLTTDEREQAGQLSKKFSESKYTERDRYVSLLREFVTTPISAIVVEEQKLEVSLLVTPEIPVAISELMKTAKILSPKELTRQVTDGVRKLQKQGIDIEPVIGKEYAAYLGPGNRPIQVFMTLKTIKEAAERHATTDLQGSLRTLRREALSLRQALPVLEREYGMKASDIEPILKGIDDIVTEAGKDDVERIVNAVDRLLLILERRNIVTKAELVTGAIPSPHAAAVVEIARDAGWKTPLTASLDVPSLVTDLTQAAPDEYRWFFEQGTNDEQRAALLKYLGTDKRLGSLLAMLREEGRTDMDARYRELVEQIKNVGTGTDTEPPCDDSMVDALRCTNKFMKDVQETTRGRSTFSRFIGTLQDLFGIDS
ncbi:MAG: hypothetical protein WC840_00330 [Candidatus Peribacteraceae bacterium]